MPTAVDAGAPRIAKKTRKPAKKWKLTAAQQEVVAENRGLVYQMLYKRGYQKWSPCFEELESLCMEALMRAARKFDPSRGVRFSTFACRAILNEITRWGKRYAKREAGMQGYVGQVRAGWLSTRRDAAVTDPERERVEGDLRDAILRGMADCSPREQKVLRMRFWEGMKLRQMAPVLHLTRERIRQIQAEALARMRAKWE